jgi:hypothetical protein
MSRSVKAQPSEAEVYQAKQRTLKHSLPPVDSISPNVSDFRPVLSGE